MSCYACTRKYGMFCKEAGCANCGFSFCLKCLKKEIEVPRRNNEKLKVCLKCYEKLFTAAETAKQTELTVGATANSKPGKSKLEANDILQITDPPNLLDPVLEPISLASSSKDNGNSSEIAGNLDSEILKRLHGLKTGDDLPGDDEIRSRLCNLQGFQQKEYSKKDILLATDLRTEQEKINDLLKQFVDETDIDSKAGKSDADPVSDIERRLAALRDADPTASPKKPIVDPNTPSDNEDDDDAILKNIMQRYLDESRLPEPAADVSFVLPGLETADSPNPTLEALEELPWCTVCNEDATLRCQTCGGDLFCDPCFKDCHYDDEVWRNHETLIYSKPPTFKEDHF